MPAAKTPEQQSAFYWGNYDLKSLHTRELMGYLRLARAFGGRFCPADHNYNPSISIDDIKAELATRPHVPNKQEGKEARRKAALQHHGKKR